MIDDNRLAAVLRKKFPNPRAVLHRLGIDGGVLEADPNHHHG
jgi:hypothetical protein